jgi:hypothetical protein
VGEAGERGGGGGGEAGAGGDDGDGEHVGDRARSEPVAGAGGLQAREVANGGRW